MNGENILYVDSATEDLKYSASSNEDGYQGNKPGRHVSRKVAQHG